MSAHKRITTATVTIGEREFRICLQTDGLHVREKYSRDETVIPLTKLLGGDVKISPTKANPRFPADSIAETLDIAACDLNVIAQAVHERAATKQQLSEVKESVLKGLKIIRSLEVVT